MDTRKGEEKEAATSIADVACHSSVCRYASIYILLSYVAFLVYQLYTHISLFEAKAAEAEQEEELHGAGLTWLIEKKCRV